MIYAYDLETYPNVFTATFLNDEELHVFEISERCDDSVHLRAFLSLLSTERAELVGFNNLTFDYPILHYFIQMRPTLDKLYKFAMTCIRGFWRIREPYIRQIDLLRVWHFDNKAKMTSLKQLEFAMRMDDIRDLPYAPGTNVPDIDNLIAYNIHDTRATWLFYKNSLEQLAFRRSLGTKWLNYNDGKIGKQYFIQELERAGIQCYDQDGPRQTVRNFIDLGSVILPYIKFEHAEFNKVLSFFRGARITQTKGVFKNLKARYGGLDVVFGLGGIHASHSKRTFESDGDYTIYDWDVASYYPNLAIANRFFPAHLGEVFCDIYKDVFEQRKQYPKTDPRNGMLKLALNSVYGDSNNKFSVFYDPAYTMSITINGQLLLCMVAERLRGELIQINTDGLTIRVHNSDIDHMHAVVNEWQSMTGLTLESAIYSKMIIRDVNNYIALGKKTKLKGAYEYKRQWHQNHSALVVPKAVEAHLVHGQDLEQFILNHDDVYDFMLLKKTRRTDRLLWDGQPVQRVCRYYAAIGGAPLVVEMPAKGVEGYYKRARGVVGDYDDTVWQAGVHTKNKSKHQKTCTSVHKSAKVLNKMTAIHDIDYDWYISEARKLCV